MIDCYYTTMPPQFENLENPLEKPAEIRMVCYQGVHVYVRPYDAAHYQITGLCTTNPAYYLREDLKPGALIPILCER